MCVKNAQILCRYFRQNKNLLEIYRETWMDTIFVELEIERI